MPATRQSLYLPSGDVRWYDFGDLRGSSVVDEMQRILGAQPMQGAFHHRVLCGHRGSGKSTELLRLKAWADDADRNVKI